MNRSMFRRILPILLVFVVAACGSDEETGSGLGVNAKGGDGALRDTTTTTAPVVTTAPPTTAPPRAAVTTAPPTTAPQPQNVITILEDKQGSSFVDKPQYQVARGSTVTWKNASSKPRKIAAENNVFVSPEIPPGGSWTYKAAAPAGVYNYRDTTRPYAVAAQLQVY